MKISHVLSGVLLILLGACATTGAPEQWIRVGVTTRAEVVEQYGEPDMVTVLNDEETVIYRAKDPGQAFMLIEIPTAQVGPSGTMTTKTQSVTPGLGARPVRAGALDRPGKDFRIRYDSRGLVLEVQ